MKFLVTILLISSFIILAVGFLPMIHDAGHDFCFMTILGGKPPCPVQDPLGYANFHANTFKNFSTAVLSNTLGIFAFSAAIFLIFISIFLAYGRENALAHATRIYFITRVSPENRAKTEILHWLSFHTQSPNNSLGRG